MRNQFRVKAEEVGCCGGSVVLVLESVDEMGRLAFIHDEYMLRDKSLLICCAAKHPGSGKCIRDAIASPRLSYDRNATGPALRPFLILAAALQRSWHPPSALRLADCCDAPRRASATEGAFRKPVVCAGTTFDPFAFVTAVTRVKDRRCRYPSPRCCICAVSSEPACAG